MEFQSNEVLSSWKHQISQNIAKLYLCQICHVDTDAVQNQLVGDVKAPLIKVVPVKDGNVTYVHYNKPNFLPISRSNISFVKLNKKDERGNLHSFQSGISIITLLFYNVLLIAIILSNWVWITRQRKRVSCMVLWEVHPRN